jgi:hypothetical protein
MSETCDRTPDEWEDGYDDPCDFEDWPETGEDCGRWINGRLGRYCTKAGSEECDFECPYRDR